MSSFTLAPLATYNQKKIMIVVAILAGLIRVFDQEVYDALFNEISFDKFTNWLNYIFQISLIFIIFSKEKVDDERVKMIRARAMRITLFVTLSSLITASAITNADIDTDIFIIYIFLYLLVFNIGLIFSPAGFFNDGNAKDNIFKKSKKDKIEIQKGFYLLVVLIILQLLFWYL